MVRVGLKTLVGLFFILFAASLAIQLHLVDTYVFNGNAFAGTSSTPVTSHSSRGNPATSSSISPENLLKDYEPFQRIPKRIWLDPTWERNAQDDEVELSTVASRVVSSMWKSHEWTRPYDEYPDERWSRLDQLELLLQEEASLLGPQDAVSAATVEEILELHSKLIDSVVDMRTEHSQLLKWNLRALDHILPKSMSDRLPKQQTNGDVVLSDQIDTLDNEDTFEDSTLEASNKVESFTQRKLPHGPNCLVSIPFLNQPEQATPAGFVIHPSVPHIEQNLWRTVLRTKPINSRSWIEIAYSNEVVRDPNLRLLIVPMNLQSDLQEVWIFIRIALKQKPLLVSRVPVSTTEKSDMSSSAEGHELFPWFSRRQHQVQVVKEYVRRSGCSLFGVSWFPTSFNFQTNIADCKELSTRFGGTSQPWLFKRFASDIDAHMWEVEKLATYDGIIVHESLKQVQERYGSCAEIEQLAHKSVGNQKHDIVTSTPITDYPRMKASPIVWGEPETESKREIQHKQPSVMDPFSKDFGFLQQPVLNPVLVHARRCTLHAFILIAQTNPFVFLFHPGIVTLASPNARSEVNGEIGSTVSTTRNLRQESTNLNRQRVSGQSIDASVWDYTRFNEFLENAGKCTRGTDSDLQSCDGIQTRMIQVVQLVYSMSQQNIDRLRSDGSFGVVQVSFWLNENLQPVWKHVHPYPWLLFDDNDVSHQLARELLPAALEVAENIQSGVISLQHLKIGETLRYNNNKKSVWVPVVSEQHLNCDEMSPPNPCKITSSFESKNNQPTENVHSVEVVKDEHGTTNKEVETQDALSESRGLGAEFGVRASEGLLVEDPVDKLSSPTVKFSLARRDL